MQNVRKVDANILWVIVTRPPLLGSPGKMLIKDIRGWQFLAIEAAETLCMVCIQPEEHISKKIIG